MAARKDCVRSKGASFRLGDACLIYSGSDACGVHLIHHGRGPEPYRAGKLLIYILLSCATRSREICLFAYPPLVTQTIDTTANCIGPYDGSPQPIAKMRLLLKFCCRGASESLSTNLVFRFLRAFKINWDAAKS
jgi:hypothetical protein